MSREFYNIASRATQSNSVYVSMLKIPIVLADGMSKSVRQNFFARERQLSARGKILYFGTIIDTNRDSSSIYFLPCDSKNDLQMRLSSKHPLHPENKNRLSLKTLDL